MRPRAGAGPAARSGPDFGRSWLYQDL